MFDQRLSRAPRELWLLFEGDDAPCQYGSESGFTACTSTDNQHRVGALDGGCLQQTGYYHRLHQIAASAERQILVDVGDDPEMLGNEELAPDSGKGAQHTCVNDLARPELALDHVGAGRPEFGHRIKPAD